MPDRSKRTDNPTVRRILDAAEHVFEEHGFDGARIDEIAARAGVAKSHLYYHFDGKQQLFDDLVALRVRQILDEEDELVREQGGLDADSLPALTRRLATEVMARHAAFVRIALLESIAAGTVSNESAAETPLLIRIVQPLLDDAAARFESLDVGIDRDALVSHVFNFAIVPSAVHVALGERAAAALGISAARAEELFLSRLVDLHPVFGNAPSRHAESEGA